MTPSLFSLPLTASTTSRCRPSPSPCEGYVIQLTRPAEFSLFTQVQVQLVRSSRPRLRGSRGCIEPKTCQRRGTHSESFSLGSTNQKSRKSRLNVPSDRWLCEPQMEDQVPSLLPSTISLVLFILRRIASMRNFIALSQPSCLD